MVTIEELRKAVERGVELLEKDPEVTQGVAYASANSRVIGRLVYTSHFPCNGVEEPKSSEDFGVCIQACFETRDGKRLVGAGQEPNDLSPEAWTQALEKARRDAAEDPDFVSFPDPNDFETPPDVIPYHDEQLFHLSSEEEAELLARISWGALAGAMEEFTPYLKKTGQSAESAGLIVSGDNFLIRERMAVANTLGVNGYDESTITLTLLTAMIESQGSKGTSWGAFPTLAGLSPEKLGRVAAENAVQGVGGVRVPSGRYTVILAPPATTEIARLIVTSLNLEMVEAGTGIFTGKFGQKIAPDFLTIYDDGAMPGGAGTKGITCEGYPTGRTSLITNGVLTGLLTGDYTWKKVLNDPEAAERVGVTPEVLREQLFPRNGFRFGRGGGRIAATLPKIAATNLVVESINPKTLEQLLTKVGDGILIGKLWYTYPIGGWSTGDITGTVIADSFLIRDGKIAEPLQPNTLRLNDNLKRMIDNILGITAERIPTILWASDEVTHAPWIAIQDVRLDEIGESLTTE